MEAQRWATFDCYGTLIDWQHGIMSTFARLWADRDPVVLLEAFNRIQRDLLQDAAATYRVLLTETLVRLAREHDLPLAAGDHAALVDSLPEWPPFPEVPAALAELRRRGWRLAILSNTDPDLLDASLRRIGVPVDERITAAEAGSYKPALGHWEAFARRSGARRAGWVHVGASLYADVVPANQLALPVVWIDRASEATSRRQDPAELTIAARLPDLAQLPDTLDHLVAG
jgi:2-haloacid dehalogenase